MYSDYYGGFDDELIDQYLGTLYNLKTLLYIKKELGEHADITDRYFGHTPCCDSGEVFFRSTMAIILDLTAEQELSISEEYYTNEDFYKTYPDIPKENDFDEITELVIPAVYSDICEQVFKTFPQKSGEFKYRKINKKTSHIYFPSDEWPFREDLFNFFIKVRKIAEGLEVAA